MDQNNNTFIPNDVPQGNANPMAGLIPQVDPNAPTGLVPPSVQEAHAAEAAEQQAQTAQAEAMEQSQTGNVFLDAVKAEAPVAAVNPNILICSKCGSEMKKESRYCMKCGNLNYSHPENESMKKYAWQSIKQGHFISGANLDDKQHLSMPKSESISNVHPYRGCVIGNVILFAICVVLTLIGVKDNLNSGIILGSVLAYGILFLETCSLGIMFVKADEPWWGVFVPFYGTFLMYKISLGSGWLMFLTVIPVVGTIVALVAQFNLGKKFYKSGLLTLFFPFIMFPIIAFDKNTEYSLLARAFSADSNSVDAKGRTKSEKEYGRKKFFITFIILVVVAVVLYVAWPYLVPIIDKIWELMQETISMFK